MLFIELCSQKIDRQTFVAKANKFLKIIREKPTLVVFQEIYRQTYLQSPKSIKACSFEIIRKNVL